MNLDPTQFFPDLEALTPDGRWAMLQKWLKENPEYGERAERWSTQTVDLVFDEIINLTTKKYGPLAGVVLGMVGVKIKIKRAIETMQACYRERARECKAEYSSGWIESDNDPRPSAHKSIHDYQRQLKAKRKRNRK